MQKILRNLAVVGNVVIFLWISFMMITKGFPKSAGDISITILVLATIIISVISLLNRNK